MTQKHTPISLTIERLWQFSLQYYSVKEVKEACLSLQNNYHGNVNLLLILKWLDEQKISIQDTDWNTLLACIHRTDMLIHTYRDMRRKYKQHLPDTLYREALEFELQLEKQQQADLVDCVNNLILGPPSTPPLTTKYCQQLTADHLATVFSNTTTSFPTGG